MDVTIVAIPSEREAVWKYSSEKVPHMTLLYLGKDVANLSQIIGYVEHVCSSTMPIGMSVEDRGTLGPDNADVLFFAKDKHGKATVSRLRQYLLDNENIKKAYESVDQYPEWTPHLTMGYPATPAKPDERDYPGFGWIEFDRVAIWTDDYSGPEFKLKYPELEEVSMVMSDKLDALLEHHGVKGMKWGVRNDRGHEGQRATNKKIAKLDKQFARKSQSLSVTFNIHNKAADKFNSEDLERINSKYKAAADRGELLKETPTRQRYTKEIQDAFIKRLQEAADSYGTNASGTQKYNIYERPNNAGWDVTVSEIGVKHADNSEKYRVSLRYDSKGRIVNIGEAESDSLQQSDIIDKFLEHFGVKGMHWGVRKADPIPAGEVRVTQKKPGTRVTAAGGHSVPAHPDAIRAATAKQKAKSSSTDSLSNKELQDLVTRLNLEQQYSRLATNQKGTLARGNAKIKEILDTKNTVDRVLSDPTVKPFVQKAVKDIFDAIRS